MEQRGFHGGLQTETGINVIDCGVSLDVTQADRLCGRMRRCLDEGGSVVLDTRQLQRLDQVGVTLLKEFVERAQAAGMNIHWSTAGTLLEEVTALLAAQQSLANFPQA